MKTALFLFLSLVALPGFSQSKKALNKNLLEKHAQLVRKNDSLAGVIAKNQQKLMDLGTSSYRTSRNLVERRQEFQGLKRDITNLQIKLRDLKFDPETLVRQDELNSIYGTYEEVDYQKEIRGMKPTFQPAGIKEIEDLSNKKLKVRNELLTQKNQEYNSVIDSNLQIIRSHESIESKINDIVQKMETENVVLVKSNRLLREKYEILRAKCSELELKRDLAEIAAENAKKEKVTKTTPKNKKEKTVKFVPPVIVDMEMDYPSDMNSKDQMYEYDPPPVVRDEMIVRQEPEIVEITDEQAYFPGGRDALMKYLEENLVYPQVAKEAGLSGKVYLRFVISQQGNISNVKIMRGVPDCPECDREAVRVVKKMPNWIPGKINGKAVNSYYNLPIAFKL